ncbi:hypothetical protein L2E02_24685, partial [Salmonella enterica subsp. enterica serovar Weltevreden]|nr:hypothetical protein [Salmonella enterica subsp. enterica serovar Weltevreden]
FMVSSARCVTSGKVERLLFSAWLLMTSPVVLVRYVNCVVADTSALPVLSVWWLAQRAFAVIQKWL